MNETTIDRAAMARLAKALVFICGAAHPTTVALKVAAESGSERDIKSARALFLRLKQANVEPHSLCSMTDCGWNKVRQPDWRRCPRGAQPSKHDLFTSLHACLASCVAVIPSLLALGLQGGFALGLLSSFERLTSCAQFPLGGLKRR